MKKSFLVSLLCLLLIVVGVNATPGVTVPVANTASVDVTSTSIILEDLDVTRGTGNTYAVTVKGNDADFNTTGSVLFTPAVDLDSDITVILADTDFNLIGTGTDTVGVTATIKKTFDYETEMITLGTIELNSIVAVNSTNSTDTVAIASKTFTLYYDAKSRLLVGSSNDLEDIGLDDIEVDDQFMDISVSGDDKTIDYGETFNVKPKDTISLYVEASNLFSDDMRIDNVEANVFIEGFDGNDDDIDIDEDIKDIRDGRDEKVTIEFDVPYNLEEDTYPATITVTGEDEEGAEHTTTFEFEIKVKRSSKDSYVKTSKLSQTTYTCGDSDPRLSFKIVNMGRSDRDDFGVRVESTGLNFLYEESDIELESVQDDEEDGTYSKTLTISVPESARPGDYDFYIYALIDDNDYDAVVETLTIEKCVEEKEDTTTTVPVNNDAVINEPISIVPSVADNTDNTDNTVTGAAVTDNVTGGEDNSYLILLAVGNIVLFVAVIGLLIAVMTGKKHRRD